MKKALTLGKKGKANILKFEPTGLKVRKEAQIGLSFTVKLDKGDSFEVYKELVIPAAFYDQVQPGNELEVGVNKNEPKNGEKLIFPALPYKAGNTG